MQRKEEITNDWFREVWEIYKKLKILKTLSGRIKICDIQINDNIALISKLLIYILKYSYYYTNK